MTQTQFEIRSKVSVYSRVKNPTAVFNKTTGRLLKIGEYDDALDFYNFACNYYSERGEKRILKRIVIMELPKDQDEIDKVYQNPGYIKRLYKQILKSLK